MQYTVNEAISSFFNTSHLNIDVKALFDSVPNDVTPILKLERTDLDNVLLEDSSTPINLCRLAKLASKDNSVYFSKNDKRQNMNDFNNWFSHHNVELGVSFVLSIMGAISFLVIIVFGVKSHRIRRLIAHFKQVPQAESIKADQVNCDCDLDNNL